MYQLSDVLMTRDDRCILDIPTLTIPTDKLTVVLGHNGSGKSTLVSLLAGQQAPDQGLVTLNGKPMAQFNAKALAKEVAFLPQKLPASAGLTVREVVRLGRFPWRGLLGRWSKEDEQLVNAAMAQTKVTEFSHHLADNLSGGERQRAWVAMLLAQQSPVLILDEPTSALDIQHQYHLMALLAHITQDAARGMIVILHDLNLALLYADHIVALAKGKIAFEGNKELLLDEERLSALYNTSIKLIDHPVSANKLAVVCPEELTHA